MQSVAMFRNGTKSLEKSSSFSKVPQKICLTESIRLPQSPHVNRDSAPASRRCPTVIYVRKTGLITSLTAPAAQPEPNGPQRVSWISWSTLISKLPTLLPCDFSCFLPERKQKKNPFQIHPNAGLHPPWFASPLGGEPQAGHRTSLLEHHSKPWNKL